MALSRWDEIERETFNTGVSIVYKVSTWKGLVANVDIRLKNNVEDSIDVMFMSGIPNFNRMFE